MEPLLTTPKEQVGSLDFVQQDVLITPHQRRERRYKLKRAMMLGNLYQGKVTIKFRDRFNHLRKVETTIWAVFEDHISLKSGMTMPIRSIEDIEF